MNAHDIERVHPTVDMFIAINHFNSCVRSGSVDEVSRHIRDVYDVNLFDVGGLTAIHHAVNSGNLKMIKLFLDIGANYTART